MTLTTVLKGPLILSQLRLRWLFQMWAHLILLLFKWRLILCSNFGITLYLIFCYLFSLNDFWAFHAHIRHIIRGESSSKSKKTIVSHAWDVQGLSKPVTAASLPIAATKSCLQPEIITWLRWWTLKFPQPQETRSRYCCKTPRMKRIMSSCTLVQLRLPSSRCRQWWSTKMASYS